VQRDNVGYSAPNQLGVAIPDCLYFSTQKIICAQPEFTGLPQTPLRLLGMVEGTLCVQAHYNRGTDPGMCDG